MKKLLIIIGIAIGLSTSVVADEWPRKLWEIDLAVRTTRVTVLTIGIDGETILAKINGTKPGNYLILKTGQYYKTPESVRADQVLYLDNNSLVYKSRTNSPSEVTLLHIQKDGQVVLREFEGIISVPPSSGKGIPQSSHLGVQRVGETNKFICWDFRPPAIINIADDDGNGGGNETANSRLIIKTAGSDIALATDGKLGPAELQKSNDLRSWRRLGDVPAEASEVLVAPSESGNEFYRLKKK